MSEAPERITVHNNASLTPDAQVEYVRADVMEERVADARTLEKLALEVAKEAEAELERYRDAHLGSVWTCPTCASFNVEPIDAHSGATHTCEHCGAAAIIEPRPAPTRPDAES